MKYLIRSTKTSEILIYFTDETDLRIIFLNQDDLELYFVTIIMNFTQVCPQIHLKVFGVPETDLTKYKASGSTEYAYDNEPDDQYRLRDMEVETAAEYEAHKLSIKST